MYVYWHNVCILVQCKYIGTIYVFWPFDQSHSFVGIHVKHLFSFALSLSFTLFEHYAFVSERLMFNIHEGPSNFVKFGCKVFIVMSGGDYILYS